MREVTIYTDGSWKKNLRQGGWACLLSCYPYWQMLSGNCPNTTISRMELLAVLNGLNFLTEPCNVIVISDSMYVVNCINVWIYQWAKHNWKKSNGYPIENQDLIFPIYGLLCKHDVHAKWIKSHTSRKTVNYLGNACVDYFAQACSESKFY